MGSCITHAPATLDDFLAVINACATSAGGPDWAHTAMLGAAAAVVLFALFALLGFALARWGRA